MNKIIDLFRRDKVGSVYAVYEDDLDGLLESAGLSEKIKLQEEACCVCGNIITQDNLQAIVKVKDKYSVVCHKQPCVDTLHNRNI